MLFCFEFNATISFVTSLVHGNVPANRIVRDGYSVSMRLFDWSIFILLAAVKRGATTCFPTACGWRFYVMDGPWVFGDGKKKIIHSYLQTLSACTHHNQAGNSPSGS